ncbi:MAG TPA: hypothetical protein VEO95_12440, partial [Chthoniobacteraceae bacterium]|nr:hypothetical protein [Chthoniobacteraceae bacterium]
MEHATRVLCSATRRTLDEARGIAERLSCHWKSLALFPAGRRKRHASRVLHPENRPGNQTRKIHAEDPHRKCIRFLRGLRLARLLRHLLAMRKVQLARRQDR